MPGVPTEMTRVVEVPLHVFSSSRRLPRLAHLVVEIFPAAREGKLQCVVLLEPLFVLFGNVPLTNASHIQGVEK